MAGKLKAPRSGEAPAMGLKSSGPALLLAASEILKWFRASCISTSIGKDARCPRVAHVVCPRFAQEQGQVCLQSLNDRLPHKANVWFIRPSKGPETQSASVNTAEVHNCQLRPRHVHEVVGMLTFRQGTDSVKHSEHLSKSQLLGGSQNQSSGGSIKVTHLHGGTHSAEVAV